ncbi:MAG: hypothetical protein H8E62_10915 [Planctomycetes bacterium]|nr:hypothetical protein [Planctomycetota bacterium]
MPEIYRAGYDRAMSGRSLRAAINAKCLDCPGWQRTEIRDCPAVTCPLWLVRPYQSSSKKKGPIEGDFSDSEEHEA